MTDITPKTTRAKITTDIQCRTAAPEAKLYRQFVGGGLYLEVAPSGSKIWRMKYKYLGKEKRLTIGRYGNDPKTDVSLKAAKQARDEAKLLLAQGIDPSAQKKAKKEENTAIDENTFKAIALEFFQVRMLDKSATHQERTKRCLEMYLFPRLAHRPIKEITTPELLDVLRDVEKKGILVTVQKTRQAANQVFKYAITIGKCDRNPTTDIAGALLTPKRGHFAAITEPDELGKLMTAIEGRSGSYIVTQAMKCQALWLCRPGELRQLEWSQVNWDEERIEIVSSKTNQEHIIPLARQSLEILQQLHNVTSSSRYVFPSARGDSRPMSENAIRQALRDLGYTNEQMTAHGFRATARTLLDEVLNYRIEWIEQQLAHEVRDANGRSYNRTKHLKQRREMMQHWADYLDQLRTQADAPNILTFKRTKKA